ncbi:MAG: hypothetical protein LQ342_004036 [Letrouitia transgressa]|nr:MAG: hypothetical protein LQ342_004036 [Letrouitia transgressa]
MPSRLATPLLSVDTAQMHQIDTRNVENLFGMWTVFSKSADFLEDGRRLENLSWRIWNRETLCCEPQPHLATTPAIDISNTRIYSTDVPELSASVDSVSSDEEVQGRAKNSLQTAPLNIRASQSHKLGGSMGIGRAKEKHITSLKLEQMVVSIKERRELEPLSPSITDAVREIFLSTDITPRPESPTVGATLRSSDSSASTAPLSNSDSDQSMRQTIASDTSAELSASHSIVRGFSPSHISSSYRSHTHLAPSPIPTKSITHIKPDYPKAPGMFLLGAGSSGEDDSSFDDQMLSQPKHSSLTAGLKRPLPSKKQTSFKDVVESRTINNRSHEDEEVFESDDDQVSESAIDDDDEDDVEDDDGSDWEDSVSENAEPVNDKQLFQRVDSKPNLISRRSLLTTMMHQKDRAMAFANMASKSTPTLQKSRKSGPSSDSSGSESEEEPVTANRNSHYTRAKPIIMTTSNTHPPALSPRSTRRRMLATELTESLRKHLLWERQQKSTTANAVLKRRHTAHDMAHLQDYPGQKVGQLPREAAKNSSWNHYFDHGVGEYNEAGW